MSETLGWMQLAGVLLGGGLVVLIYALIWRMCRDRQPDAKASFLFKLLKSFPEDTE